tara:strand:- start:393 stop:881 length:489 start_codon:yes stop_codon:yes gene_type:complete
MNTYKKIRGLLTEAQNIPRRGFVQQHRADTRAEGQPKGAFSVKMAKDAMAIDAEKDALKKQDRMRNFISRLGTAMFRTKRKAHSKKMKDAGIVDAKKINMNGYSRIYEMLLGEEHGMPSRNFPGHEKRMKGHIDRIQNDPRFKVDAEAKQRGGRGSKKTDKK